jgi:PIN domain nuclease of toxin-antitoxin system
MNLLVDTHAVIWFITEDKRLSKKAWDLISDSENNCFVSIASLWEMGIKHSLERLDLNVNLQRIFELIDQSGFVLMPVTPAHILTNATLYFHHRDPFDRLMIAQAKTEGLYLVSKDQMFKDYPITVLWDD